MAVILFNYQKEAIKNLKSGSILCGGVGSGKSLTALGYYFEKECWGYIDDNGHVDSPMMNPMDLYIITTARKRDTLEWEKECINFLINKDRSISHSNVKLVIDSWNNIGKYKEIENAFFIFDEQRLVGSGTWVKSFLKIAKKNKWLLLSATPGDTWMDYVPVFIANGFYKNRTDFIRSHVIFNRFSKYPKIDTYIDTWKLSEHRKNILVNMDYIKKTKHVTESMYVEYQEAVYKEVSKKRWNIYTDSPIKNASELCYTWRKIVNSDPSRIKKLEEIIILKKKVIVFYNFNYELDLLLKLCEDLSIPHSEWNGHKHQPIPQTASWVYLVQYTAGAEGWNCIETDTIVFYSQNYSYKIMHQSAGRIDRLNSPFVNLYYYHLLSRSPIDLSIHAAIKNKKMFNENSFVKF